jgi:hypothetical protein
MFSLKSVAFVAAAAAIQGTLAVPASTESIQLSKRGDGIHLVNCPHPGYEGAEHDDFSFVVVSDITSTLKIIEFISKSILVLPKRWRL